MTLKKSHGHTLIEVLVTILFIAVGVIALIRFQNYLAYDNAISSEKGTAILLASKQLETLQDFQVLNTTSGYSAYQDIVSGSSSFTGPSATYTITWTVTSFTNPTYKTIDVTVSWTDRRGGTQSVRLSSRVGGIDPSYSSLIM